MCLAGQVLPLLDTRIGHQVFTVLTLDSFCLLLFHITKGKRDHSEDKLPQSSQSSSELSHMPGNTHSWGEKGPVLWGACSRLNFHSVFLKFHQRNRKHQDLSRSSSLSLGLSHPHFWCATKLFYDMMATRSHTPAWPKRNILGLVSTTIRDLGTSGEKK